MSGVYAEPLLYDLAFAWRNFRAEADAIERFLGRRPESFLELAAGPADLAIELSRRSVAATALDLSPAMCTYAREKAAQQEVPLLVVEGDLHRPPLAGPFAAAALVNASLAHVHSAADFADHLAAMAKILAPDGIYLVEIVPRRCKPEALQPWVMEAWGLRLETRWGTPEDHWDPESRILEAQVEMRLSGALGERQFRSVVPMREWTAAEVLAVVEESPFAAAGSFAELSPDAPPLDDPQGRCVLLLRHRS